jgi:hypothetical protein
MSEEISRRDFIKLACMATVSTALTACPPGLAKAIGLAAVPGAYPVALTPPTPSTESSNPSATPDVWKLSLSQQVELLREPDFFTELQGENTKKIITLQFDDSEYIGMNRKAFHNNSCGQSTLATIEKMCGYLNTGIVPDTTIADIDTTLDGLTFTDIKGYTTKYIVWDDEMCFVGFPDVLELLIPQFISKTEFLSPNYGARYTRIVPQADWPDVLSKAQTVCEDGGFVIIFCLKYGAGHILLATDVKNDGTAVVVDSFTGTAQRVLLKNYFDSRVDPNAKLLGEQPGLLNMIGVTSKLNVSS